MSQTLESFVEKNGMRLTVVKTVTATTAFPPARAGRTGKALTRKTETEWAYELSPPALMRTYTVCRPQSHLTLTPGRGTTRREAREDLLRAIRGGTLEYANVFDRQSGHDPRVAVPKSLR